MAKISEIGGKRVPFLRSSVWRMALGMKHLTTHWQVGDGREQALADQVTAATPGDLDDAIRAVDDFCYPQSVMMNVGGDKGEILDAPSGERRRHACSSWAPTADIARCAPCG